MDQTSPIPHTGKVAVAVKVVAVEVVAVKEVAVAEVHHHQDPERQGMVHTSLHTWTANHMAKALTSLLETNKKPKDSLPSGTSSGASTIAP